MQLRRTAPPRRAGFTLIEMIVVIAIIAVLVSLLSSALFSIYSRMAETQCRNEITNLAGAVTQFESDYNITVPPPSRLWLDESGAYNVATYLANYPGYASLNAQQQQQVQQQVAQLAIDSQAYLRKVWPRLQYPVDWNSDNVRDANGNLIPDFNGVLEGEQCLVFFLGGAKNANGAFIGFSTDTTNPMSPTANRKGPYFQFVMSRISPAGNSFPQAYYDTYSSTATGTVSGQPYAYFSSGRAANGYNAYPALGSDCPFVANGAYYQSPGAYHKPDTFQIISAGKNKQFGQGGPWTGPTANQIGPAGVDDLSNFATSRLGIIQ